MAKHRSALVVFIVLCLVGAFASYMLRVYPGFITDILMSHYQLGAASYSLIQVSYFFPYALTMLLLGFLGARWSIAWLWVISIIFLLPMYPIVHYTQDFSLYLFGVALLGCSNGVLWFVYIAALNRYVSPASKPLFMGLFTMSASLGRIVSVIMAMSVVTILNWEVLYVGAFALALLVLVGIYVSRCHQFFHRDKPAPMEIKGLLSCINPPIILAILITGIVFSVLLVFVFDWSVIFEEVSTGKGRLQISSYALIAVIGYTISSPVFGYLTRHIRQIKSVFIAKSSIMLILTILAIHFHPSNGYVVASLFFIIGVLSGIFPVCSCYIQRHAPVAFLPSLNVIMLSVSSIVAVIIGYWIGHNLGHIEPHEISIVHFQQSLTPLGVVLIVALILSLALPSHTKPQRKID